MKIVNAKKFLLILTGVFMGLLMGVSLIMLMFVSPGLVYMAAWILQAAAAVLAVVLAVIISAHFRKLNKLHGDGDKDSLHYFKRIAISVVLVVLLSAVIGGTVGIFVNGMLGGMRMRMIDNGQYFLQGFIVRAPLFLIYLAFIYNMFSQQGYKDANRKTFNLHLKALVIALALILLLPGALRSSMHGTQDLPEGLNGQNLQAVLSLNADVYSRDPFTDIMSVNPDFNPILPVVTVMLTFALQIAFALFAYNRGKQAFLKKRLNPAEVETDEKC